MTETLCRSWAGTVSSSAVDLKLTGRTRNSRFLTVHIHQEQPYENGVGPSLKSSNWQILHVTRLIVFDHVMMHHISELFSAIAKETHHQLPFPVYINVPEIPILRTVKARCIFPHFTALSCFPLSEINTYFTFVQVTGFNSKVGRPFFRQQIFCCSMWKLIIHQRFHFRCHSGYNKIVW